VEEINSCRTLQGTAPWPIGFPRERRVIVLKLSTEPNTHEQAKYSTRTGPTEVLPWPKVFHGRCLGGVVEWDWAQDMIQKFS